MIKQESTDHRIHESTLTALDHKLATSRGSHCDEFEQGKIERVPELSLTLKIVFFGPAPLDRRRVLCNQLCQSVSLSVSPSVRLSQKLSYFLTLVFSDFLHQASLL